MFYLLFLNLFPILGSADEVVRWMHKNTRKMTIDEKEENNTKKNNL